MNQQESSSVVCAHGKCTCAVKQEGDFCSPVCEEMDHEPLESDTVDLACPCGHAECHSAKGKSLPA